MKGREDKLWKVRPYYFCQLHVVWQGSCWSRWYLQMYWQEMDHVDDIFETASTEYSVVWDLRSESNMPSWRVSPAMQT